MNAGWIDRVRDRLRAAWAVLTGRAYAAYSYPDHMGEVNLRIALIQIGELIANKSFIDTREIRPLVEHALD